LKHALQDLGVLGTLDYVVNTHPHEDHIGNNDLLAEFSAARFLVAARSIPDVRWPVTARWYRSFMFGPLAGSRVHALPAHLETGGFAFDVISTPGHTPDHVCLFERSRGWLFAGDLYVDERLDAQLLDVDGVAWIESLDRAAALAPELLLDGHGTVI